MDDRQIYELAGLFKKSGMKHSAMDAAIFVDKLHGWLKFNRAQGKNFKEGRFWSFSTLEALALEFQKCEWSVKKIWTIKDKLVEVGFLFAKNFNKTTYNRQLWYSLPDHILDCFGTREELTIKPAPKAQKSANSTSDAILPNGKMDIAEKENRFSPDGKMLTSTYTPKKEINTPPTPSKNGVGSAPVGLSFEKIAEVAKENGREDLTDKFFKFCKAVHWINSKKRPMTEENIGGTFLAYAEIRPPKEQPPEKLKAGQVSTNVITLTAKKYAELEKKHNAASILDRADLLFDILSCDMLVLDGVKDDTLGLIAARTVRGLQSNILATEATV